MQNELWTHLCAQFRISGSLVSVRRHTVGHINDTYIVRMASPVGISRRYVMQRINTHVFQKPELVMENIQAVTEHLREKIIAVGGDPHRETINLLRTIDGQTWYKSPHGDYWRAYPFIEGARTYDVPEKPEHFFNAGKAFGFFQRMLSDFPAGMLHETIPQFHNTKKRYNDLTDAIRKDAANRVGEVGQEIDFVQQRAADAAVVVELLENGRIPLRVTHNDTKLNNVLIDDKTGEGVCVVDLDTVMPGSALYDFGDAIRFGASAGAEDERDLSKVWLDLELFRQFTAGYLATAGEFLTPTEFDHLAFSVKLITYELGMRFLTDHLNGDVYFKIHRPGHNLDRARAQLKLVEDIEAKLGLMQTIVEAERWGGGHAAAGG